MATISKDQVVPRPLAADLGAQRLSPTEGYVYSRIDGRVTVAELRALTGLPEDQTDDALARLLALGLVSVPAEARPYFVDVGAGEEHTAHQLEPEQVAEIEGIYRQLGVLDHFALLGVPRDASARQIKQAYFQRSKQFHPDRFYGRELGPFRAKLNAIFATIKGAYDLLGDDARRARYLAGLAPAAAAPRQAAAAGAPASSGQCQPAPGAVAGAPPAGDDPEQAARLAQRRAELKSRRVQDQLKEQFGPRHELLRRAEQHYRQGLDELRAGKASAAAINLQLAAQYAPDNAAYQELAAELTDRLVAGKVRTLSEQAEALVDNGLFDQAAAKYEEAFASAPRASRLAHQAAILYLRCGQLGRARQLIAEALKLSARNPIYHIAAGEIALRAKDRARAGEHLEAARRLAPGDQYVIDLLAKLRGT